MKFNKGDFVTFQHRTGSIEGEIKDYEINEQGDFVYSISSNGSIYYRKENQLRVWARR